MDANRRYVWTVLGIAVGGALAAVVLEWWLDPAAWQLVMLRSVAWSGLAISAVPVVAALVWLGPEERQDRRRELNGLGVGMVLFTAVLVTTLFPSVPGLFGR